MVRRRKKRKRSRSAMSKIPPLGHLVGLGLFAKQTMSTATYLNGLDNYEGAEGYFAALTGMRRDLATGEWTYGDSASTTELLIREYSGIAVGIGLHEVLGNSRGAFGTDIGLKLNGKMPGGVRI